MKKRLISMLMAVLMIASLLPASALAAGADVCPADPESGDHQYTTVSIKKDADAKTPGVSVKVCKNCGEIDESSISIKAFALLWDQCRTCKEGKTMTVITASCRNPGLVVSYCAECGKAFAAKDFGNKAYKVEDALEHVYSDFKVIQEPTCTESGYGYAICKLCGDPVAFDNETEATDLLKLSDFSSATAYANRVREVYNMFAPTNPKHEDESQLVAVTKETTTVNKDGQTVTLYPAKAASHISTVGGVQYKLNVETGDYEKVEGTADFEAGYTGDKVCPDCGMGFKVGEKINHDYVNSKDGDFPSYDETTKKWVNGSADTIKCEDCRYVGGASIKHLTQWYGDDAVEPTCTEAGNAATLYWIDKNGDVQSKAGAEKKALGHNYVLVEGKAATCLEDGFEYVNYKKCTRCDYTTGDKTKTIKLTAPGKHDYQLVSIVDATCQHQGLSYKQCKVCGEKLYNANGTLYTELTAMVAHTAADKLANVKEATCTEVGYTGDKVCKFCGTVMEEGKEVPMLEHIPVDVAAKAPTCTEAGITKGTVCSVCKTVLTAQETVPALGHKTEIQNAKEATCTEAGYTGDTVCTVCKETVKKGEVINALGHSYIKGVCTRCDAKQHGYNPFSDVKAGPYYDAILWAYENGVTEGKADGTFGVNDKCTRAQIVTFLYRAAGSPEVAATVKNPFTDVSSKSPYYNAILWAVSKGITTGTTATTFSPNAACTRAQIVTFLWRYEGQPIVSTLNSFSDVSSSSVYYNAIMWAVDEGITQGITKTSFEPGTACTRAQAVTFIYRDFSSK